MVVPEDLPAKWLHVHRGSACGDLTTGFPRCPYSWWTLKGSSLTSWHCWVYVYSFKQIPNTLSVGLRQIGSSESCCCESPCTSSFLLSTRPQLPIMFLDALTKSIISPFMIICLSFPSLCQILISAWPVICKLQASFAKDGPKALLVPSCKVFSSLYHMMASSLLQMVTFPEGSAHRWIPYDGHWSREPGTVIELLMQ